jgi:spermidine synthase
VNVIICLILLIPYWKNGLFHKTIPILLSALIVVSGYMLFSGLADKLHYFSITAQWKNQHIVHYQNSQYGNICVIENQGQYLFFQDGNPTLITPVPDIPLIEEFVHLPMLTHHEPERLLILSGGAGGVINEIIKHPSVKTIEYAELDPLLLDLLKKFPTPLTEYELNDKRVSIKHHDGYLLLKTTEQTYGNNRFCRNDI